MMTLTYRSAASWIQGSRRALAHREDRVRNTILLSALTNRVGSRIGLCIQHSWTECKERAFGGDGIMEVLQESYDRGNEAGKNKSFI